LAIGTLTHFLQSLTFVPYVFLGAMLFFSLSAHGEFKKGMRVLNAVVLSNVFGFFALLFHHAQSREAALYYLVGLGISWLLAHDAFSFVFKRRVPNSLHHFSGLFSQFPLGAALCLIGILGILGFPLASTFLGVEMLFEHAATSGWVFLVAFALTFVLNGITLIRLHSRIFMGERDAEIPEARFDYQPWQAALWIGVFVVGNWLTWI
jgi:NADH-quinone oxidoreductase subunit L